MKPFSMANSLVLLCGVYAGVASASTAEEMARQTAADFTQAASVPMSKSSESKDVTKAKAALGGFVKRVSPNAAEGK